MKFKSMTIFFLAILFVAMPVFSDTVTLNPSTTIDLGTKNIGDSVSSSLSVTNTGSTAISTLYFDLEGAKITGNRESPALSVAFQPSSSANFAASAVKQINFSFTTPNAYAGAYSGTLNAKNASASVLATVPITLTINQNASLTMIQASTPTIVVGEAKSFNLSLENTGNVDLSAITFLSTDLTSGTNKISSNKVSFGSIAASVNYKSTTNWPLTVTVPSTTVAGTYNGTVTASFLGKTATLPITVIVEAERLLSTVSISNVVWAKDVTTQLPISFTMTNTGNKALTNEQCILSAFKDAANNDAIATTYFSSATTLVSSLAVGATSETKTITLTQLPQGLPFGTYTATLTCDHAGSRTVSLSYREQQATVSIPSEINLGGSNQARNSTITSTYTVTNNGDIRLNNVELKISSSQNLKFSTNSTNYTIPYLDVGQSQSLTLSALPDYETNTGKINFGSIQVSSSDLDHSYSSKVYVETKSMLDIDDAYVKVSGSKDKISPSSSASADIEPGSHVAVTIKVKSLFDDSDNFEEKIDINNVEFNIVVDDLDIDENSLDFTLKPGKDHSETVEFDVPYDLDSDEYTMDIKVTGEDDEQAEHKVEWSVRLDVKRDSRKLKVLDGTSFSSTEIFCDDTAYLDINIINIGDKELDNVVADVKSVTSGFSYHHSEKKDSLSNDHGNSDNRLSISSLPIDLKDKNLEPGKYKFLVTAYYNNVMFSDSKYVEFTCSKHPVETISTDSKNDGTDKTDDNIISVVGQDTSQQSASSSDTSTSADASSSSSGSSAFDEFRNSNMYIVVLVGAILLVFIAFFIAIAKL